MAGYTPLFSSLTTGTLCGKWPDIGLWPIVLSLTDRYGVVDVTPDYLCRVTGLQIEAITACMQRFCEPDPFSRSQEAGGARLKLIDPARPWGWQVINHRAYREKARKETFDAARVADGRNAARLKTRAHPRSPALTRADPPSDSNTNSDKSKRGAPKARRVPEDFNPDREYAKAEIPDMDVDREIRKFRDWEFKTARSDWPACWRTWVGNCRTRGDYARAALDPTKYATSDGRPPQWR